MTFPRASPTVECVRLPDELEDLPLRRLPVSDGRRPILRVWGLVALGVIFASILTTEPRPGLTGDRLGVTIGLAVLISGIALSARRRPLPRGRRFVGLCLVSVSGILLLIFQPHSAGFAVLYYVMAIAGLRLSTRPAVIAWGIGLGGELIVIGLNNPHPWGTGAGLVFSTLPWYLVTRLVRRVADRHAEAETLVEELRESREAVAQSAALAERSRVARDMHDVLAHSLSALALQLEGTRLLARDRGADPEVVDGLERAHHLAATGLAEARQAIAALRGDALPGPERLRELADAFPNATLTVRGEPREHSSEARLALYRTAQEALTNVRKHSAADRVEISLDYAGDGTTLVVVDHGPGAPVIVGAGGGYGLTGMRERAELLGGRLSAEPTADGFRVELWLP
jgi:signal transduction histidine kinase